MMRSRRWTVLLVVATPLLLATLVIALFLLARQGGLAAFRVPTAGSTVATTPDMLVRGEYLAQIGNCIGCHTEQGRQALAGGRAFRTEYGTVYSSNISSHPEHGIGNWSKEEFRHTMRHGISRNGLLSPVFPFTSFRRMSDEDLDALLAYLLTVPAADRPRTPNAFKYPANLPGAMTVWRLLFLQPPAPGQYQDAEVAQGAYLVNGIGHCASCHASRGSFASQTNAVQLWGARNAGWFAPALHGAALQRFAAGDVARYLQGDPPGAAGAYGLMADVVARNLQHLSAGDAQAIEAYLRSLPAPPPRPVSPLQLQASERSLRSGRSVYEQHCADCHGEKGEGQPEKFPSLRASPAITQSDPINLIKLILFGAVAPTTAANTAPYTMPPFAQALSEDEVADLVNFLRGSANPEVMPVDRSTVQHLGGIASP